MIGRREAYHPPLGDMASAQSWALPSDDIGSHANDKLSIVSSLVFLGVVGSR